MENFKTRPYEHQLTGLNRARGREAFDYSCEQGTGKSWMLINDIAILWGEGKVNGLLIFAPNGVQSNWVLNEIPAHMPDWVRCRAIDWRSGAGKKHKKKVESILTGDSSELRILTMNVEALQHKGGLEFAQRFVNSCTKLAVALDESHYFKNPSAARTKNLMKFVRPHARFRRTLSGTPVLGKPFDVFAPMKFLDETILRTTSYYAFKAEYADFLPPENKLVAEIMRKTGRVPQIVKSNPVTGLPCFKNMDRLRRLIEPHTFRVLKKDCLDLPEKVYTRSYFFMEPAQRKLYDQVRDKARMETGDGEIVTFNRLVALGKLQQISSGFVIDSLTKEVRQLCKDNPKLALLRERLEEQMELETQVIVFAWHREELTAIAQACIAAGWPYVAYHGGTSKEDRIAAIQSFQSGEARIFVAQTDAASTGITLTAASHVIYYSNSYKAGARWQSEDRAHRIGQKRSVTYEDLLAYDSREEDVVTALVHKKDIADLINGDLL